MTSAEPDWDILIQGLGPKLYRYFCGSFPSAIASDLVQETLIRLVQKRRSGEFSPTKGDIKAYAFGIARFVRLEALKAGSEFDLVDDEKKLDVPVALVDNKKDQVAHLRRAIKQLSSVEQDVILLMIDGDLQLDEISNELQIPVGTVKSHVHRAKEKLRKIMEVSA